MKPGTNNNDVVTLSQLDTKTNLLQGVSPGLVVNDKAVIYSDSGSVHPQNLYLKDAPEDGLSNEIRILTPHQSYNNIHLEIPDLKNYDGFGCRRKSEMMVTSVDQTVTGKKTFQNIEVPTPTSNIQASNKYYVDYNFLNRLNGGIILGTVSMNHNDLIGIPDTPKFGYSAVNKNYLDNQVSTKADLSKTTTQTFQGRVQVPDFKTGSHYLLDVVNMKYIENGLNSKLDKLILKDINLSNKQLTNLGFDINNPGDVNLGFTDQKYLQKVSDSDLDMDEHRVVNSLDPVNSRDLTTKNYVDTEIGKIPQTDTAQFLKIDGTRSMTGDLDMDSYFITNVGISSVYNSST